MSETPQSGRSSRRIARLVEAAVGKLELELDGKTVYTEAATGGFASTAAAAAAAGADRVYALARDSSHGTAEEAVEETAAVAEACDCRDRIEFVRAKTATEVGRADIVTNTGFVRPIDVQTVSWLKETAVVSLMYEPWEFRDSDLDIEACWDARVPVLGTDESDPRLETQAYLGHLAAKLAFENGIEVKNCRIVVTGSDPLAVETVSGLETLGADVTFVAGATNDKRVSNRRDTTTLGEPAAKRALERADALVAIEHTRPTSLIGPEGELTAEEVSSLNEGLLVIHICGNVDETAVREAGVSMVPTDPAPPGRMSFTLEYLGPRPTVDLQAGGLKVGELLSSAREEGLSMDDAVERVAQTPVAADFSDEFKRQHGYDAGTR